MKIKNNLVTMKIGKKQYDFNNLILDEYLKRFVKAQLDSDKLNYAPIAKKLDYCLLKFDEPFTNLQGNTELHNQDFNVCIMDFEKNSIQTISENQITVQYNYGKGKTTLVFDYSKKELVELSKYNNRKITAIGFNSHWVNDTNSSWKVPVCAVLDTSNYNIYLQENQELSVTRKDIITTDALFYSNDVNKVPGPAHLAPCGISQIIEQPNIYNDKGSGWVSFNNPGYGILYSIGFSSYIDYIDQELIVGQDIQIEENGTELSISEIKNYLSKDSSFVPSSEIYPSDDLYPIKQNYKYIIFKYKVWQIVNSGTYDNIISTPTDTGYYYHQAIPINKFGKSNLKIKYERS